MPSRTRAGEGGASPRLYLNTGQTSCYGTRGEEVPCAGSGQDAEEVPGLAWPEPRFEPGDEVVLDRLTGLAWTRKANFRDWPMEWAEAFRLVRSMNRESFGDCRDWRLPNRRELRSLITHQTRDPALPSGHPFLDPFLAWYWTSTTAAINPAFAWYVHLEGGRMFYGGKREEKLVWPVRGQGSPVLPATGQVRCFNEEGEPVDCRNAGQDGELRLGTPWPRPRFKAFGDTVLDRLTGLRWTRDADLSRQWVTWEGAFQGVREAYWSSTSSGFEPDWCMALYMRKGAVGVGQKKDENFSVWAVSREG